MAVFTTASYVGVRVNLESTLQKERLDSEQYTHRYRVVLRSQGNCMTATHRPQSSISHHSVSSNDNLVHSGYQPEHGRVGNQYGLYLALGEGDCEIMTLKRMEKVIYVI